MVVVAPFLRKTATFSTLDEGAVWARRVCLLLLEQKNKCSADRSLFGLKASPAVQSEVPLASRPDNILVNEVLEAYQETGLGKHAGEQAEKSRLRRLTMWFGQITLGELNARVRKKWQAERLSQRHRGHKIGDRK